MRTPTNRQTVDLSGYPDLVVIYLGMRINALAGLRTMAGVGPELWQAGKDRPDGLLHYENNILYSLFPFHLGMRWYWRDFESMERWTRSEPHRRWWQDFLKDSGGTGFWHETYFMSGGMEAVYVDVPDPVGMQVFAPSVPARGAAFSARRRAGRGDEAEQPDGVTEEELY